MLYFVKWAHLLIKIHVINTNMRRLIAALSNGRRPLRFKLDQHRHIHINYTCLNRIWQRYGIVLPIKPQWQLFIYISSYSKIWNLFKNKKESTVICCHIIRARQFFRGNSWQRSTIPARSFFQFIRDARSCSKTPCDTAFPLLLIKR